MSTITISVRWDRDNTRGRMAGRDDRAQRGVYAIAVCETMTGQRMSSDGYLTCPLTGKPFLAADGEVDKADPSRGYVPGNIVMVSKSGNQQRSALQQHHGDMAGAQRYVADVMRASLSVMVPRKRDAIIMWQSMGRGGYADVVAGPYGVA